MGHLLPRLRVPAVGAGHSSPRLNGNISLVISDTTEPAGMYYSGIPPCGDADGIRCDPSQFLIGSERHRVAAQAMLPVLLLLMASRFYSFNMNTFFTGVAFLALNTQNISLSSAGIGMLLVRLHPARASHRPSPPTHPPTHL